MILDKKNGLEFIRNNKSRISETIKSKDPEDSDWAELDALLDIDSKAKYLFSKSVTETLDTIKLKDEFDCNILQARKTINGIILLSKFKLYIFNTIGENLRVVYFNYHETTDSADVMLFTFKIVKNEKIIGVNISTEIWKTFLQCIIYLDFLPIEIKYINAKEKFGNIRENKIINKTDDKFILVTKAWNQKYETLSNTKYFSKAHWGIRWSGENRLIPKLTFVKASFKEMNKLPESETKRK
jgi:hypothetical protein